jgi:hypothetical protein
LISLSRLPSPFNVIPMRLVLSSLLLLLCASLASAAEVEFVRVWPGWRDADSFERIGEYFGRPEKARGEVVLRTKSEVREGYYFLVRVKAGTTVPANSRFELNVIRPDNPEAQTFTFAAPLAAKETVFQLGLTGVDWPGGKAANPVAWRLALLDASGRTLAEQKSFLWEKPAK